MSKKIFNISIGDAYTWRHLQREQDPFTLKIVLPKIFHRFVYGFGTNWISISKQQQHDVLVATSSIVLSDTE